MNESKASGKREALITNEVLARIRKDMQNYMETQEVVGRIYLINNFDVRAFDFPDLYNDILDDLPSRKKEALVRMLQSGSDVLIREKVKLLRKRLMYFSLLSGVLGGVPVPGVSFVVDMGLLVKIATDQREVLGLNEKGLQKFAEMAGISVSKLKEDLSDSFITGAVKDVVVSFVKLFPQFAIQHAAEVIIKYLFFQMIFHAFYSHLKGAMKSLPIVGIVVGSVFGIAGSFANTYYFGNKLLEKHESILQNITKIIVDMEAKKFAPSTPETEEIL